MPACKRHPSRSQPIADDTEISVSVIARADFASTFLNSHRDLFAEILAVERSCCQP
jgi:hypothetical protein